MSFNFAVEQNHISMTKQLLIIPFFCFFSVFAQATTFHLTVETPSVLEAECTLFSAQREQLSYKVKLHPERGDATFHLDIDVAKFITFTYGKESIELFVEPTDSLTMRFRAGQLKKTIRFEGAGRLNNECLTSFQFLFRNQPKKNFRLPFFNIEFDSATVDLAQFSDAESYLEKANNARETEILHLATRKAGISRPLYSQLWKNVIYTYDTRLYTYFIAKNMNPDEYRLTSQRFFPFRGFNYTDYERNETPVFRTAMKAFLHAQARQISNETTANTLYETIEKKMEGYDRFWLQKELLVEVLNLTRSFSFGRQHIEQYRKDCPFKDLILDLEYAYDDYLDVGERAEAPDFQFVTSEGNVTKLSEFRGKVVYLNFWASWCQPCIQNFTKYADVRAKLNTEGVVLLNVSIDDQPEKFQDAVTRLSPVGINAQPMNMTEAKKLYSLYAIPAYYIVDKNGKFAHLPEKNGRDVVNEFKKLLAE
jgi:thiol-disulfide isomerase/thioredoxin